MATTSAPPKSHVIVLLQTSKHDSTRFYNDFATMHEAVENLIHMYEMRLKEINPAASTITYDFQSLMQYLDDMREVCFLSWDQLIQGYKRYDLIWVKQAVQDMLANAAHTASAKK